MSKQVINVHDGIWERKPASASTGQGNSSKNMVNWRHEFARALQNDEFIIHYQPIVDAKSQQPVAVEALLRWQHPTRGLMVPLEFIPMAEETGCMVKIGEMALRKACLQAREWANNGVSLRMNVNVSLLQIRQEDFPEMVQQVVAETGIDPCRLELELTESLAYGNPQFVEKAIQSLHKLGIQFALDDIGSQPQALQWIMALSLSTLKLDRNIIHDIQTDAKRMALVKSIHTFAQDTNVQIVAEGVESLEEAQLLCQLGCEQLQGFFFGRPGLPNQLRLPSPSPDKTSVNMLMNLPETLADADPLFHDYRWLERCTLPALDERDIFSILTTLRDLFEERFDFDRFGILVGTINDKYCVVHELVTRDDMEACPPGSLMIVKDTGLERVYHTGKLHYNPDIQRQSEFIEDDELAGTGLRSLVRIPLMAKGRVFGVMTVKSVKVDRYSVRDRQLMQIVANRLSSSIYSLKLIYSLREASYKDPLTGAFNRRFLSEITAKDGLKLLEDMSGLEFETAPRTSVIFVDVDQFKVYNDLFGHSAGDAMLVDIAQMLAEIVGDNGFVVRYGGDEFALVLPGKGEQTANETIRKIRLRILDLNRTGKHSLLSQSGCSLSMGLADGEWAQIEHIVARADTNMYEEKHARSN